MLILLLRFIAFVAVIALVVMGPLFLIKKSQFEAMGAAAANMVLPPTVVTAAEAKADTWENTLSTTGSFVAVQGVTVGAEVPGKVVKIGFEPGATANAGDLLIQLDTSIEESQLRAAEANSALAKANLERTRELRQNNTNSPAELDAAEAQFKQAQAQADNARALIEKKTIRAPFTGRLGLRLVNLGQILKDGEAITTLQTLDPIYVNFSVPQQRLAQLAVGNEVRVTSDASPGHVFSGKITAISPEVDAATRNIRIQATLANDEAKLRGGMFASVEIILPSQTKVLMIPVTSVLYAPYGDSVFVIDEKKSADGKVEKVLRQQFVRLSGSKGDFVNVVDGLKPGETVVTSGVFKLRPGMAVTVDNKLAPNAQLAPKPKDA